MPPSSGLQYAQDIFLFSICQEDLFVLVYSSCGCALRGHLIHPEWKMADEYFLRAHNKYIFLNEHHIKIFANSNFPSLAMFISGELVDWYFGALNLG